MAEVLAEGYNVLDTSKSPSGTVKYLSKPADVISLIAREQLLGTAPPDSAKTMTKSWEEEGLAPRRSQVVRS